MTGKERKFARKGFTLLELMTVVVIIGILAAVATPLLTKYLRKSKTAEAAINLRKIYDGESSYYIEEHTLSAGTLAEKQFVGLLQTPSGAPGRDKNAGVWNGTDREWGAIRFAPDGPVLYAYSVPTGGVGAAASFTARAIGDMDGDGLTSLFERVASVNGVSGEVEGGAAIYTLDELE